MKIGIEAQRIFRTKKHGMDIVAVELVRHLQQLDKENEYFIFVKEDDDTSVIRETANFRIITLKGGPYPYWEQVALPRAIKEYGIDLLHCTSNTAPLALEIPLVVTLHDIIYLEKLNLTKGTPYQIIGNLYRRWNVPKIVKKAAAIITVSNFERERITSFFQIDPHIVRTVYNGVGNHFKPVTDPAKISYAKRKYSLPDNFVFYLGNTDPKKNLIGVLRALSYLRKKNQLTFTLLMLDIDRTFLRKAAASINDLAVLDHIRFSGYIPNDELPAIYSMANAFLYPSLRESFGIPILEAMRCGIPVITSTTSSMPEVAQDAALLVDPADPQKIGETILELLSNNILRSNLIEKGHQRSDFFSWQNNAQQTLSLYREVLANHR